MTFEEFAGARTQALLRYATVLTCDRHLAEDIVQEVLVRTYRKWKRIEGLRSPETYVRRMITNQFLSWRRRKASTDLPQSPEVMVELGAAMADPASRYDERDALLADVAALPKRQRAALVLRYYSDLPDEEIAEIMGCGTGTVRSHISRALATLRVTPSVTHV
ncbi:RNA polymerase sigma-70 factor (sigma-E family) [Kibdelosporangium banguiense]|uniref:RNA polymerase sigma-70 factor (Sigma-E family) n=1 Tax=Kibdelosporangium banguiense TaxID=1365924 RepID=A0ABS4U2B2_9PSEU|nr:SigE family RNA polymerase sigma factor [Kibdelosporangium banguiense]MBP2330760.1 RNA polymerase sigma-70 factor (sigma-E family) [Kibdelosporangium banguiense]